MSNNFVDCLVYIDGWFGNDGKPPDPRSIPCVQELLELFPRFCDTLWSRRDSFLRCETNEAHEGVSLAFIRQDIAEILHELMELHLLSTGQVLSFVFIMYEL